MKPITLNLRAISAQMRRRMEFPFALLLALASSPLLALAADPAEPKFRAVTVDGRIQIGYGVAVADVDGDKLPDILLADKRQFVWYRNPGAEKSGESTAWQKHVLAENLTKHDNVCLAAEDIDGDGRCEIAVGAEWNPGDTVNSGAVFYLIPPADRTQKWNPVKLHAEPTTHRMRWIRLGDKSWGLVVVPLHGRGNKNGEGAGVKVLLYHPPTPLNDPEGEWKTELIDDSMHMTHNFDPGKVVPRGAESPARLVLGGREGVFALRRTESGWTRHAAIVTGMSGGGFQGAGEVRGGKLRDASAELAATVEPMHGNSLVVYTALPKSPEAVAQRQVLTDKLSEGHALGCGDILGLGSDQIVVGWRGKVGAPDTTIGVAVWTPLDPKGEKWRETVIDPDGMACEDLQLADLNGDGKLDIVASGRATKNVKIYFNETR